MLTGTQHGGTAVPGRCDLQQLDEQHCWPGHVTRTPLVGGQWRIKDGDKYDIVITDNKTAPNIPVAGTMEAAVCRSRVLLSHESAPRAAKRGPL
jgi:hypothetical protein